MHKFLLLLNIIPLFLFGQSDSILAKIKKMAVYADCKKEQTNKDLTGCFSKKIQEDVEIQIFNYNSGRLESYKIQEASAIVTFVITKHGKIINSEYSEVSHPLFGEIVRASFLTVVSNLKEIEPAFNTEGNAVNLIMKFPVKYQLSKESLWENEISVFQKFPEATEVVYAVLDSGEKMFEVRVDRDFHIKIYEKTDSGFIFLGTFPDLYEVESAEPYKTIMKNTKILGKFIKADGRMNSRSYRILFDSNDQKFKVYENANLVDSYKSFRKFLKSPYAELILRK